ncbi:uncharacterized protein [Dasypus novemcinctus]|uniref:uncharacterized protein n=1 Tax=Dasypus novemcinctus TaxID=9361 RepID=UPI00265EB510|nr:uncharacterized protein LOC131280760 [Dasypus novemcinctus]
MDTGPLYFFDQLKPKREKWMKRQCEDLFSGSRDTSTAKLSCKESIDSKGLASLSTIATSFEKVELHSFSSSQSSSSTKRPTTFKFSQKGLKKKLFKEYKFIAPEILYELGETLQKYAEGNITFPMGIANLVNYSWKDLTEGSYKKKCTFKNPVLKQSKALQKDPKSKTIVDLNGYKITNYSRKKWYKRNHLNKGEKENHVGMSKSMQNLSSVNHPQPSLLSQDSSLSTVIHFSLTSKMCLENGWIFHHPYSTSEILEWKKILSIAVKRLQVAIIQIKTEEAKLKKEGFNKQLILRHYNDPEEVSTDGHGSQCFWFELLKRKPQMPKTQEADPAMKKFHYALMDGSSLT